VYPVSVHNSHPVVRHAVPKHQESLVEEIGVAAGEDEDA